MTRCYAVPITTHSGSPRGGVEAWFAIPVNPASRIYAATRRCWSGPEKACQIATALVGKHRLENDTANGAPVRDTRRTSRNTSTGRCKYSTDTHRPTPSKTASSKVGGELLGVHAVSDDGGVGDILG